MKTEENQDQFFFKGPKILKMTCNSLLKFCDDLMPIDEENTLTPIQYD
jgi:hypothetical protein